MSDDVRYKRWPWFVGVPLVVLVLWVLGLGVGLGISSWPHPAVPDRLRYGANEATPLQLFLREDGCVDPAASLDGLPTPRSVGVLTDFERDDQTGSGWWAEIAPGDAEHPVLYTEDLERSKYPRVLVFAWDGDCYVRFREHP